MTQKPASPAGFSLNLGDIYYAVFRHKWKILAICALAIIGAAVLPRFMPVPYQSEAKLFVRYVRENNIPARLAPTDSRTRSPDERGENVINTEFEILTSLDLAQEVATIVGPEEILAIVGGGTNVIGPLVLSTRT